MSRRIIGPFNRVEGDLEVQLEMNDGQVAGARVVSPLYRGFEQILQGKDPMDALVYVPRICGICSVAQSVASAQALAQSMGLSVPHNGELATNLILACENAADHLTHFYLFFMPDFAREVYASEPWYQPVAERFKAVKGTAARDLLPARAQFMHLMGLLAGKWPHSLALQPGGTTRAVEVQEKTRIKVILYGFRQFLEQALYGDSIENVTGLDSIAALDNWRASHAPTVSDFSQFLHIADALNLDAMGRAADRFMSYGVYEEQGEKLFDPGVWDGGLNQLDQQAITEDISHSWMHYQNEPKHPFDGVTLPSADEEGSYTWCKAPRLDDRVVEVGAISRQLVNGHPLIRELVAQSGGNVRNRVIARVLEIGLLVQAMEQWADRLQPKEPFCNHANMPGETQGFGMIEAARGSLGHWVTVKNGRILNYQIIAPTTWNFSPRDSQETPGALEQALVNAPVRDGEKDPVSVQHIVRSFDPCMVCTVH
jgi:uptake hydrogenase large subunit